MLSMHGIHEFFEKVVSEVESVGKADLAALATGLKAAFEAEKNQIVTQIANASPDVQAAVQQTLAMLEQALLAALAAKGL